MRLFKRILLALFPEDISQHQMNPASMFVSFISAKQFFSVINRKIVENYKLNLFDVSLDPFEVKIGFGEKPAVKVKDVEFYYGYAVAAHMNGYRVFNPCMVASSVSIVSCLFVHQLFRSEKLFYAFLYSVYLIHYLFAAKLKRFPYETKEANYNWFIVLFFSFFAHVLGQYYPDEDVAAIDEIKNDLLKHTEIFMMLFYACERMSQIFSFSQETEQEYYHWLFYDEFKKSDYHVLINDFLNHRDTMVSSSLFSGTEQKVAELILPTDILVAYAFDTSYDFHQVVEQLLSNLYDKNSLKEQIHSFLVSDEKFDDFLLFVTDYQHIKSRFFSAVQGYFSHYRLQQKTDRKTESEIDDFLSSIGDLSQEEQMPAIPDALKKQSRMMEKLMNYYVTNVGGYWVARWDNYFIRMMRRPLLNSLQEHIASYDCKQQETLHYYGGLLYSYSKNVFYYTYAFENIRAGKDRFHLPFRSTFKEVYSNMFLLDLFDENFLVTLFQDMNIKDLKLYVKQTKILDYFGKRYAKKVSQLVQYDDTMLLKTLYGPIADLWHDDGTFLKLLEEHTKQEDLSRLKESLYQIQFWFFHDFVTQLGASGVDFRSVYSPKPLIGILATCRETIFGFVLFACFVKHKHAASRAASKGKSQLSMLILLYVKDVLHVSDRLCECFVQAIEVMMKDFDKLCRLWYALDDNTTFLKIGYRNWLDFSQHKTENEILNDVLWEDLIRFRWYVKNISYYNHRFLVPK